MVQDKCKETWNATLLVLHTQGIKPVIDCSDTSIMLFPVPHCCTGAGLGMTPLNEVKLLLFRVYVLVNVQVATPHHKFYNHNQHQQQYQ